MKFVAKHIPHHNRVLIIIIDFILFSSNNLKFHLLMVSLSFADNMP